MWDFSVKNLVTLNALVILTRHLAPLLFCFSVKQPVLELHTCSSAMQLKQKLNLEKSLYSPLYLNLGFEQCSQCQLNWLFLQTFVCNLDSEYWEDHSPRDEEVVKAIVCVTELAQSADTDATMSLQIFSSDKAYATENFVKCFSLYQNVLNPILISLIFGSKMEKFLTFMKMFS